MSFTAVYEAYIEYFIWITLRIVFGIVIIIWLSVKFPVCNLYNSGIVAFGLSMDSVGRIYRTVNIKKNNIYVEKNEQHI